MPGFNEDRDYFNNNGTVVSSAKDDKSKITGLDKSGALSFARVFLYMAIYLAITTAVAFGVGYAMYTALMNANASGDQAAIDSMMTTYIGIVVASGLSLFILMLIIDFVVIRGKHSVLVPSIIYSVLIGVLFSMLTLFIPWEILGMTFGITCGVFAIMALVALLTKGNLSPLLTMSLGLFLGCGILALINFFLRSTTIYWVVSFAIFAVILLVSFFDVWRAKKICEAGGADRNMSYYLAFNMYVDFINVFIRVLWVVIILFANKK